MGLIDTPTALEKEIKQRLFDATIFFPGRNYYCWENWRWENGGVKIRKAKTLSLIKKETLLLFEIATYT